MNNAMSKKNCILQSDGACLVGNDIWIIDVENNALCTFNIESAEINLEFFLDDSMAERSVYRLYENEGKIYGFPGKGKQICRYDIQTKKKEYFQENTEKEIWCHHYAIEGYKNHVYLFPFFATNILKVDLMNLETIESVSLFSQMRKYQSTSKSFLTKKFVRYGNCILIPSGETNKLLLFNLETNTYEWKRLDFGECGFIDIEKLDERIYVLTNDNKLIEMSNDFVMQKEYLLKEEYQFIIACNNKLILVPSHGNKFGKINLEDGKMSCIEYPSNHIFDKIRLNTNMVPFSDIVRNERETILIPRISNMLVQIEHSTGRVSFKEWRFSEEYRKNVSCRLLEKNGLINEGHISLRDYISVI